MTITRHRSSITGNFVTAGYALRNPDTTEKEELPVPDTEDPRDTELSFMFDEMKIAEPEDKAEWMCEIVKKIGVWKDEMIGEWLVSGGKSRA